MLVELKAKTDLIWVCCRMGLIIYTPPRQSQQCLMKLTLMTLHLILQPLPYRHAYRRTSGVQMIPTTASFVIVLYPIVVLCLILIAVRVPWVFNARIRVLNEQRIEAFESFPSCEYMLWHFWIWDVKKFYRDDKGG